ncbi:ATP-binding protein [Streptomyces sp. NPDC000987]|uniref:ATP-binding protein n=1 Tax=Streptomyces sp. NPDC000987 TaxID=3154374 RepID=UPI00331DB148
MTFELSLLATPKAVPELRHHLRALDFEVRLCATELLTNVIDHIGEGTPVTVRVTGTPEHGGTRIEVTDPDPRALPVLLSVTASEECPGGAWRCSTRWPTGGAWSRARTARPSGANCATEPCRAAAEKAEALGQRLCAG